MLGMQVLWFPTDSEVANAKLFCQALWCSGYFELGREVTLFIGCDTKFDIKYIRII